MAKPGRKGGKNQLKVLEVGKKRVIKQVPNGALIIAGGLGGAGLLYYLYSSGYLQPAPPPATGTSPEGGLTITVSPSEVEQAQTFTISGVNTDDNGDQQTLAQLYYYLYLDANPQNNTPQRLIANGSLGANVSTFSKSLSSGSLPIGEYTVVVTDTPAQGVAAGGNQLSGSPLLASQNPNLQSISFNETSPNITVS